MTLPHRVLEPEAMDDPALDPAEHRAALAGLERLNRIGRIAHVLLGSVRDLCGASPLRILDVASGGGDAALGLGRLARRAGLRVEVHGCDVSPVAVGCAADRARREGIDARFFALDAIRDELPAGYDVITCSLFLHHLSRGDAVALLGKMRRAARRRIVVSDLERRRRSLWMVWLATRLVTRSRVVHRDGPLSVRAAFSLDEARAMADEAGLRGATIRRNHPCRFLLTWDVP